MQQKFCALHRFVSTCLVSVGSIHMNFTVFVSESKESLYKIGLLTLLVNLRQRKYEKGTLVLQY